MESPGQSLCLDSCFTLREKHPFFPSLETRIITNGGSVCWGMYLHTHVQRWIHMLYQFCLLFYIANFPFLTFNLSDNCFLASKCLMRTQLATLFIILVCDKVLLSPHSQFSFGLQRLSYRSQCGSLSSSSLEFIELGALYLCVFFFSLIKFWMCSSIYFFKCLFYLFLLIFLGFL